MPTGMYDFQLNGGDVRQLAMLSHFFYFLTANWMEDKCKKTTSVYQ